MGHAKASFIEAGFERIAAVRTVHHHWREYCNPQYWRDLNPQLTVTDRPFSGRAPTPAPPADALAWRDQLHAEGFAITRPLIEEARMAPLRRAIELLAERRIPTVFACLYDEYYQLFEGLGQVFGPIVGPGYRWVAHGLWAFHVPPGDRGLTGLTSASPHRDSMGPDPRILAGGLPGVLTLWLALTDVTPETSCIYVVPRGSDPDFLTSERDVDPARIKLTSIRALPVAAGGFLAWSTHLAHWGSEASASANGPRISINMYFQRADDPPCHASAFDEGGPVPFVDRLSWVVGSLGTPDLFTGLDWSLVGPV
jgi:hypothetical protein